ncbi:MAG: hypothetical protein ACM3ZC_16030, partial [Bacteroidota bacterium]
MRPDGLRISSLSAVFVLDGREYVCARKRPTAKSCVPLRPQAMSRKSSRRTRRGCTTILVRRVRLLILEASAFMVLMFAYGAQTWMS